MLSSPVRTLQLWCALAGVVAITGGACDGRSSDTKAHQELTFNEALAEGSAFDPNRQAPAAPIVGATEGGTVTVLRPYRLPTLDPTEAYFHDTQSILSGLVTRSLTQYVFGSDLESMVVVPDIATDVGTPNDDFTEWTYTIRPGVRFEDGTEVTAQDVAYGIERSFDRHDFPQGASYSNDYFLHGDTYRGPYRSGTLYDGIVVHGDTLTLKMARPFPDMPYWAAYPAMGPIPEIGSSPATYGMHPMATGPYKFADYEPGESLTLVRNDEWDPATDPGRHQYPDRYHFDFDQDQRNPSKDQELIDATILADSGEGRTSLAYDDPLPVDLRVALSRSADQVTVGPQPCVFYLALDYRKIRDLRVRQAVGYAYPYHDVVEARHLLVGVTSNPGRTFLPPGTPGRIDYNVLSTEPGEADPSKSMALLREAGYAPGEFTLKFAYSADDPTNIAWKDALVAGFEAGGFRVDPLLVPTDAVYRAMSDPHAPVNVRSTGWCTDWPSGSLSFRPLESLSEDNYAHFSEPDVDDEIERIGQLRLADQAAAWGALDQLVETKYYPLVITGYGGGTMLHGSRIGGMNFDNVLTMPTWKDIYIVQ